MRIKRLSPVVARLAILGLLAGCTAPTPTKGFTPTETPTPTDTPAPSPTTVPGAPRGAAHLTSGGTRLVGIGTVQTAPITPRRSTTVLVGVTTLAGSGSAPVPSLTGGGVRWTQLASATEVRNGIGGPRLLTLFGAAGVDPGPLTISVAPQPKQELSWSAVQAKGSVVQIGSTGMPLAGPPAQVSLPNPPTGTVIAFFLVGTGSTINAVAPATKLGQGDTPSFPSSTSTQVSAAQTVQLRWTPDGPGHYLGVIVEMSV
jgi:hypothetical protein